MIKIDWVQFIADTVGDHVVFGFYIRFRDNRVGYSSSWLDRLWPIRLIHENHPKWWNRLIFPMLRTNRKL